MLLTVYIEWDIVKPSKYKVCTSEQQHMCAYVCVELLLRSVSVLDIGLYLHWNIIYNSV